MIKLNRDHTLMLDNMSQIAYHHKFLTKDFADKLYEELLNNVPWIPGVYNMYGKKVLTPRLLYCMKDEDYDVYKVYTVTGAIAWSKLMLKLKKKIERKTRRTYKYAQLNYYRDQNDYIGFHTDKEVQDNDIIASVSLGCTREFRFEHIDKIQPTYEIDLEHGSLLIMNEHAAKLRWKHSLMKSKNPCTGRINITFRPA